VPADLPALTAAGLSEVLGVAARHEQAFVPDASGTGTTMLMSRTAESVLHSYGVGSAARHAELGAVAIAEASPGARHDVDTLDDLEHARGLVLGPRTVSALRLLSVDAPEVDRPHRAAKALGALPE
jgi:2-phospho-L-lactate guanylyltransferase